MIPTLVKLRFNLCLFCCMFVFFIILLWLFSHSVVSNSLWLHGLQHTRLPRPSLSPGVYSSSCPLSRWYHPTTSSSVALFSSCHQSFSQRSWSRLFLWRPTTPSRTNTKKRCPFHRRRLECKSRKSKGTWNNRQVGPQSTQWSKAKINRAKKTHWS